MLFALSLIHLNNAHVKLSLDKDITATLKEQQN